MKIKVLLFVLLSALLSAQTKFDVSRQMQFNPVGTTTSAPAEIGWASTWLSGNAYRQRFGDYNSGVQAGFGQRVQLWSFYGIDISGNMHADFSSVHKAFVTGGTHDPSVTVIGTDAGGPGFRIRQAASPTADAFQIVASDDSTKKAYFDSGANLFVPSVNFNGAGAGYFDWQAGDTTAPSAQAGHTICKYSLLCSLDNDAFAQVVREGYTWTSVLKFTDNAVDLGVTGAAGVPGTVRPRTMYVGTNIVSDTLGTATSGPVNFGSSSHEFRGSYYDGAAIQHDKWTLASVLSAVSNPSSTLTFTHTGSTGAAVIAFSTASAASGLNLLLGTGAMLGFSNSTAYTTTKDASVSRGGGAGIIAIGNGTVGDASGFVKSGNTVRVASDFTTAANTSLQTITGLSWTFPATGTHTFSFSCDLVYSQATANAAVAFGIQAATAAPTAINASGQEGTSLTAFTTGTLRALASTTATNIVSATPSAFGAIGTAADMFLTHLWGTIENPATTANIFNIMVSTATSGDAVTVYRGSYCRLN